MNKKRSITIVLLFVLLINIVPIPGMYKSVSASNEIVELQDLRPGDTINFAGYEWLLIDYTSTSCGLLMKDIYCTRMFDTDYKGFTTPTFDPDNPSNIGYYLNNDFLKSLPIVDQNSIMNSDWEYEFGKTIKAKVGLIDTGMSAISAGYLEKMLYLPNSTWMTCTRRNESLWCVYGKQIMELSFQNEYGVRPMIFLSRTTQVVGGKGGTVVDDVTDIDSFSVPGQENVFIDTENHTINFGVTTSTDLTSLTPTINVFNGATISPGSGAVQDFTKTISYTVTSKSGMEQIWEVKGWQGALVPEANDILDFRLPNQIADPVIDKSNHTVTFFMPTDVSKDGLKPNISVSSGALITPESGDAQNFTNPVLYTVKAIDGSQQEWRCTLQHFQAESPKADLTYYENGTKFPYTFDTYGEKDITLTSDIPGATIYYTFDYNNPTENSLCGTSPLKITLPGTPNSSVSIRAYTAAPHYLNSEVVEYSYRFPGIPLATPDGLKWDPKVPGLARWNASDNTQYYYIKLCSATKTIDYTEVYNGKTYYDFSKSIRQWGDGGPYYFCVMALPDYTQQWVKSSWSEKSPTIMLSLDPLPQIVNVEGIQFDKSQMTVSEGGTPGKLTTLFNPVDASNMSLLWGSSNPSVATVDTNGIVTPISVGTSTITAISVDGNFKTECKVTVLPDNTGPSTTPISARYNRLNPNDVTTTITWNNAQKIIDVTLNNNHLSTPDNYIVSGSALTIKADYISSQNYTEGEIADFVIKFDTGDSLNFTVPITKNYVPGSDATLYDLIVGGSTLCDFNPTTDSYNVAIPFGTLPGEKIAMVKALSKDPYASVQITQASTLPGDALVQVFSEDSKQSKTYTIHFTVGKQKNSPPTRKSTVAEQQQ